MSPDYYLVLPWHFLDEFLERERDYLEGGGSFIVPAARGARDRRAGLSRQRSRVPQDPEPVDGGELLPLVARRGPDS